MNNKSKELVDIVRLGRLFPRQVSHKIVAPVGGGTVVKAGTPINANGEVTSGEDAVGLLRYDCDTAIDQIGILVVEGNVDAAEAQKHSGVTYTTAVAGALPGIALVGINDISGGGGGVDKDVATDEEVSEALEELFQRHRT